MARWTVYSDGHTDEGPQSSRRTFIGSASHRMRTRESSKLAFAEGLKKTLSRLSAQGVEVVLVEQAPEHFSLVPTLLARAAASGIDPAKLNLSGEAHLARQKYVVSQFDRLALPPQVTRLDPGERLCDEAGCKLLDGQTVLYHDYHHLTASAAAWISPMLEPAFKRLTSSRSSPEE